MQLKALGGLRLSGTAFQRPTKPLLLLSYLLVEGPSERRRVAELFWPHAADHLNSLAKALSRLRQILPEALGADEVRVWATVPSDVDEVIDALERGDEERAIALYHAPFLEGVFMPSWGVELEEWVYGTRERLAGRVRRAYLGLAEAAAARRQASKALQHAEAAFNLRSAPALDTLDLERLHRLFILGESSFLPQLRAQAAGYGLALEGSRREAERYFRADEDSALPYTLPRRGTPFVGRDLELSELSSLLRRDACRLITIVGQGGAGKTRLALELARMQTGREQFSDGVYVIELETVSDPGSLPVKVAEVLGLSLRGHDDPATQVERYLATKRALLVLDNCEHLTADLAFVTTVQGACPRLKIVATSRERLHLEEEWLFALGGLACPDRTARTCRQVRDYDAVRLFSERARQVQKNFRLDDTTWRRVAEICTLVQGSPLAIELAAGWVHTLGLKAVADELRAGLDILSTQTRNIPDRHQSIRAAFEGSWALLTAREKECLEKAAVFQGGFTRRAAAAVADMPVAVLAALVDKSLVREPVGGRYGLHPLLHQYALERLSADEAQGTELHERHRAYYLRELQAWRSSEVYPSPATIAALASDIDNILSAWQRTFQQRGDVIPAAEALTWYFEVRAQYYEGLEHLTAAQAHLQVEAPRDREPLGYLLVCKAWLGHWLENDQAGAWAREGLSYLRPLGAAEGIILGLRVLGIIAWRGGDYPEAERAYREALSIAREARKPVWEAIILDGLGLVISCQGHYEEAERCHAAALDLNRTYRNPFQEVHNLANLAAVTRRMGNEDDILTLARQALDLARTIGFEQYLPYCVTEVARAHARLGHHQEASAAAEEGLRLASSIGDNWTQAGALRLLGRLATQAGDPTRAQRYLEKSVTIAWANRDLSMALRCLFEAARLALDEGEPARAALWLYRLESHPALPHWTAQATRGLLASLEGTLPPDLLARLLEQSRELSTEAAIAAALPGAVTPARDWPGETPDRFGPHRSPLE